MKKFGWACCRGLTRWSDRVFSRIRLPALDTFYWFGGHYEEEFNYPEFFSAFSFTMTTLRLVNATPNEDVLVCLFRQPIRPQMLVLEDCQDDSLRAIFRALDPICHPAMDTKMPLPNLQEIFNVRTPRFERESNGNEDPQDVDSALADMLEHRWVVSNSMRVRVSFVGEGITWSRRGIERIRAFARQGSGFEIFMDGQLVLG